jgi:hypothetical protein
LEEGGKYASFISTQNILEGVDVFDGSKGGGLLFKKVTLFCGVAFCVAGCDQNLSATLYTRDLIELVAASESKGIPLDVEIEVLETGIDKQCSKPEGAEIVKAVASVFAKAVLVGCEDIPGSMNDRMIIKATTALSVSHKDEMPQSPYLAQFYVVKADQPDRAVVIARFDAEKYEALNQKIKRINAVMNISVQNTRVFVKISNDERYPVVFDVFSGSFAEGDPVDNAWETTLEPRQEITIRTGDVKMASLARYGWAAIGAVRLKSPVD